LFENRSSRHNFVVFTRGYFFVIQFLATFPPKMVEKIVEIFTHAVTEWMKFKRRKKKIASGFVYFCSKYGTPKFLKLLFKPPHNALSEKSIFIFRCLQSNVFAVHSPRSRTIYKVSWSLSCRRHHSSARRFPVGRPSPGHTINYHLPTCQHTYFTKTR